MPRRLTPPNEQEAVAEPPGQLSTWKEIGAYLGVDVRTAQRYEQELHLPVHRLEAGSRGRVYALVEELEGWKAARSLSQFWWRTVPGLQRASVGLGALVLVMTALLTWALWPVRGPATSFGYRGNDFVGFAASGDILWRYRLPKPPRLYSDRTEPWPFAILDDLDGDGRTEALLWYRSKAYLTPDILMCFAADSGDLIWQYTPDKELRDRSGRFSANYHIRDIEILASPDGNPRKHWVALATVRAWGHPSIVPLLDEHGQLKREYVHSGHLEDLLAKDLDQDGKQELLAGGHSSSRDRATIVVLNPANMGGASIEPEGSPQQILDLPPASGELARVFFPRTPVSLASGDPSTAFELFPDGNGIVTQVYEMRETAEDWAFLVYVLGPDLSVEKVRADEFMLTAWDRVRAQDPTLPRLDKTELDRFASEIVVIGSDPRFTGDVETNLQDRWGDK